jgi:hypothetical protein
VAEITISLALDPTKQGDVLSWINAPKDLLPLIRCYSAYTDSVGKVADKEEKGFHSFLVVALAKAFKSFRVLLPQLLVDSTYINYFLHTPQDAEAQELFAHIMWGLCVCEQKIYDESAHVVKDVLYSAKNLFYGEFEAVAVAEATSNFFALMLLSSAHFSKVNFFEDPVSLARAKNLVEIFLSTVAVPYTNSLASVTMRFEEEKIGFLGEKALVLHMLKSSKQKPGLEWLSEIREKIEQDIPIKWPWS